METGRGSRDRDGIEHLGPGLFLVGGECPSRGQWLCPQGLLIILPLLRDTREAAANCLQKQGKRHSGLRQGQGWGGVSQSHPG